MEPNTKERPILFSAPMVRAILAGTKTQTRRVFKAPAWFEREALSIPGGRGICEQSIDENVSCPYGKPGDRLYVRETWGCSAADRPGVPDGRKPQSDDRIQYAANDSDAWQWRVPGSLPWRPSIHMPRWASRIDLEITGVRVERLNEISEADALAEGCPCYVCGGAMDGRSEKDCHCFHAKAKPSDFRALWESINGAGSWDANPWVWVVEFQRVGQRSKV